MAELVIPPFVDDDESGEAMAIYCDACSSPMEENCKLQLDINGEMTMRVVPCECGKKENSNG